MTRVTALALVLALTGAPAVSAFCAIWCGSDAVMSARCHGGTATSRTVTLSARAPACTVFTAETPFLREQSRHVAPAALSADIWSATALSFPATARIALVRGRHASLDWSHSHLPVLRL